MFDIQTATGGPVVRLGSGKMRVPRRRSAGATFAALPVTGAKFLHRAGGNPPIWPEHTLASYQRAMDIGAQILDVDVRAASGGTLVGMHDSTVTKTTAGTGNVSAFTAAAMPAVDMPDYIGSGWAPEPVPTVAQIFDTFGGKAVINLEDQTATLAGAQAIVDLIVARGLQASTIVNSDIPTTLAPAKAAGIAIHVHGCNTTALVDAAVAAGADIIEIAVASATQTLIDYAKAKPGVKMVMVLVDSRYNRDLMLSRGVSTIINDAPLYLDGPVLNKANIADEIAAKKVGPGWWRRYRNGADEFSFPYFATDGIKISQGATTQTAADSGWTRRSNVRFGTISGPKPGTYTWRNRIRWDAIPPSGAATSRPGFRFCTQDDRGDGEDSGASNGYTTVVRQNGMMHVWRHAGGSATLLGEVQTPAITVPGTIVEQTVLVTPTSITVTRVDTGHTLTYNDATYRGNYHWIQGNNFGYEATLLTLEWFA